MKCQHKTFTVEDTFAGIIIQCSSCHKTFTDYKYLLRDRDGYHNKIRTSKG